MEGRGGTLCITTLLLHVHVCVYNARGPVAYIQATEVTPLVEILRYTCICMKICECIGDFNVRLSLSAIMAAKHVIICT